MFLNWTYASPLEILRFSQNIKILLYSYFKSLQNLSTRELHESEQARQDHRKISTRAFMSKRLEEAQHLLGNILTDKPTLPKEPPKSAKKQKVKKDKSPVTKERVSLKGKPYAKEYSPARKAPGTGILKTWDVSLAKSRDYSPHRDEYQEYYEDMLYEQEIPTPREAEPPPKPQRVMVAPFPEERQQQRVEVVPSKPRKKTHPGVPRLKLSLEDVDEEPRLQRTVETTGISFCIFKNLDLNSLYSDGFPCTY